MTDSDAEQLLPVEKNCQSQWTRVIRAVDSVATSMNKVLEEHRSSQPNRQLAWEGNPHPTFGYIPTDLSNTDTLRGAMPITPRGGNKRGANKDKQRYMLLVVNVNSRHGCLNLEGRWLGAHCPAKDRDSMTDSQTAISLLSHLHTSTEWMEKLDDAILSLTSKKTGGHGIGSAGVTDERDEYSRFMIFMLRGVVLTHMCEVCTCL